MMLTPRQIPVDGAHNVRDLGGYLTDRGTEIPLRRFLRSDCLHRLAPGGTERLLDEGLRCVVDLRTQAETAQNPSLFDGLKGVEYVNIPLFDTLSPEALSAVKTPQTHPLLPFYVAAIDRRGPAVREILSRMSGVDQGAVLFNCTAGKDRTGIIAALLLGLAGVSDSDIINDYALTEQLIPDLVAEFLALSRARGGDVESYATLLESPADTMDRMLSHIRTHHGSVHGYMDHIDLDGGSRTKLIDRLYGG